MHVCAVCKGGEGSETHSEPALDGGDPFAELADDKYKLKKKPAVEPDPPKSVPPAEPTAEKPGATRAASTAQPPAPPKAKPEPFDDPIGGAWPPPRVH